MSVDAKILVVDDDSDIVEAIRVVLESKSYEVLTAADGKEGLEKAETEKPDLIILDVMMTRKDEGFDVCRILKKDPKLQGIPVLMLTALREETGFDLRSEAGDKTWLPADDYTEKPIQPAELIARVEKLLEKKPRA